ncbi:MAG: hypothetical protein P1U80_02035 [Pseudomonadales bacterium]|nr:hypothetical protein [Pseudomonadales bacterium]
MKFNKQLSIIVAASCLVLAGCSDKPTVPQQEIEPTKSPIPSWVLVPVIEDGIAATDCVVSSGNFSIDRKQAIANARVDLSQQIETKIKAMDKTYARKTDTNRGSSVGGTFESVSKQITQQSLNGARPIKADIVELDGKNHLCIMVALSPTFTDELFSNIIKKSGVNLNSDDESVMKEEFKAYKAQQEMEAEFNKQ